MAPADEQTKVAVAVITYCVCSGSMLLVNKLSVHHIPSPALVTCSQFVSASVLVYTCKLLRLLEMDDFEWGKAKHFLIYVVMFTFGTWTNMKVLSMANVETVIVFRSCAPIAVAMFDYIFYNRAMPNTRSYCSLLLITMGAVCYILTDREFQTKGWEAYKWATIWWVVLVFQLTYGKFLVSGLKLKSLWTPVLYTNTFSVLPALALGWVAGEFSDERLQRLEFTPTALFWLGTSCLVGICISWAGFWCQSLVTATTYTVVGVMNKMLTVTVNVLIWDKHASTQGIGSLLLCLVAGSLYQQAPLRESRKLGLTIPETEPLSRAEASPLRKGRWEDDASGGTDDNPGTP